ncbi:MAG: hypothetical protein GY773_10215 [Actinomycetia bacterium]|nr:hypothetical protein [Actinomycetes bacterium]MCP5031446.1 hypothetical protein [Actinomycetes bacterium]
MSTQTIQGFTVRLDRAYDCQHHMWVEVIGLERVRIGMDPLGLETSGSLAQLQFSPPGTIVGRGGEVGSLEAEKFVGPLVAPLGGTISAINEAAMAEPSLVERDPYGGGWMIELQTADLATDLAALTRGEDAIIAEFERKIDEFRRDGVLAE